MQKKQISDSLPLRWYVAKTLWEEYLEHASKNKTQLDRFLQKKFKENKKFGKKDRAFYSEALFSFIRFYELALTCQNIHKKENIHLTSIEDLKKIEFSYLSQVVSFRCPQLVASFSELKIMEGLEAIYLFIEINQNQELKAKFAGFPVHLLPFLEKRILTSDWSLEQVQKFIENHSQRPPVWIRANHENVFQELEKDFNIHTHNQESAQCEPHSQLTKSAAYTQGLFEIQDLASQWIGRFLDFIPRSDSNAPPFFIWDTCAGAGGKTFQLASQSHFNLRILASDIRKHKIKNAQKRMQEINPGNTKVIFEVYDARIPRNSQNSKKNEPLFFDIVFLDAPCSSSGTLRRNPEQALFLNKHTLNQYTQLQLELLDSTSKAVKKNGYLVYATCSFLCEENEDIVSLFLSKNKNFQQAHSELFGSPFQNSDTMFRAILKKID